MGVVCAAVADSPCNKPLRGGIIGTDPPGALCRGSAGNSAKGDAV